MKVAGRSREEDTGRDIPLFVVQFILDYSLESTIVHNLQVICVGNDVITFIAINLCFSISGLVLRFDTRILTDKTSEFSTAMAYRTRDFSTAPTGVVCYNSHRYPLCSFIGWARLGINDSRLLALLDRLSVKEETDNIPYDWLTCPFGSPPPSIVEPKSVPRKIFTIIPKSKNNAHTRAHVRYQNLLPPLDVPPSVYLRFSGLSTTFSVPIIPQRMLIESLCSRVASRTL